jgi:hypothetical protein
MLRTIREMGNVLCCIFGDYQDIVFAITAVPACSLAA